VTIRELRRGEELDHPVLALALDEGVSDHYDAVAVAELQRVSVLGGGGERRKEVAGGGQQQGRDETGGIHGAADGRVQRVNHERLVIPSPTRQASCYSE